MILSFIFYLKTHIKINIPLQLAVLTEIILMETGQSLDIRRYIEFHVLQKAKI